MGACWTAPRCVRGLPGPCACQITERSTQIGAFWTAARKQRYGHPWMRYCAGWTDSVRETNDGLDTVPVCAGPVRRGGTSRPVWVRAGALHRPASETLTGDSAARSPDALPWTRDASVAGPICSTGWSSPWRPCASPGVRCNEGCDAQRLNIVTTTQTGAWV